MAEETIGKLEDGRELFEYSTEKQRWRIQKRTRDSVDSVKGSNRFFEVPEEKRGKNGAVAIFEKVIGIDGWNQDP